VLYIVVIMQFMDCLFLAFPILTPSYNINSKVKPKLYSMLVKRLKARVGVQVVQPNTDAASHRKTP
jgi:hypothetical protein